MRYIGLLLFATTVACATDSSRPQDAPPGSLPNAEFEGGASTVLPMVAIHGAISDLAPGGTVSQLWAGIQVQNAGTESREVFLDLLNEDGTTAATLRSDAAIEPGASHTFILNERADPQPGDPLPTPGWQGAARARAAGHGPLRAVANIADGPEWVTRVGDSYEGISAPRRSWRIPYLDVSGELGRAVVAVHNPSGSPAQVHLTASSPTPTHRTQTIPAGATHRFVLNSSDITGEELASQGAQLEEFAAVSAIVESNVPVAVAVVNRLDSPNGPTKLTAYTPPEPNGDLAPLINFQPHDGYDTTLFVQNGPLPGDVVVRYTREDGESCDEVIEDAPAGATLAFGWSFHPARTEVNRTGSCRTFGLSGRQTFIGMAQINPDTAPLADGPTAVVVQENGSRRASAYATASQSRGASTSISFPLLQAYNGLVLPEPNVPGQPLPPPPQPGWWSGFSIANPTDRDTTVTCRYLHAEEGLVKTETYEVGAKRSVAIQHTDTFKSRYINEYKPFVGSAECSTSANVPVLALVNQQQDWTGAPLTYVAPTAATTETATLRVDPQWMVETPLRGEVGYESLPPADARVEVLAPAGDYAVLVDGVEVDRLAATEHVRTFSLNQAELAYGQHSVALANSSGGIVAESTVHVSAPLYLVISTDFDDTRFGVEVQTEMARIRDAHEGLIYSHFFAPYHFTDPEISDARRDEITTWIRDDAARYGDELGVHVHGWCHFVQAAGLGCRNTESYTGLLDATGYTTHIGAYPRPEMRELLEYSKTLYAQNGLGTPTSFRAGAWSADTETLQALVDASFTVDSSAAPNPEQHMGQGGLWYMKLSPFYAYLVQTWQGLSELAVPYWPGVADLRIPSASPIGVLEVPDSALMVDYLTVAQHVDILHAAAAPGAELESPALFQMGFHPNSWLNVASQVDPPNTPRLNEVTDDVLTAVDPYVLERGGGPGVWVRISDLELEDWE